MHRIAGRDIALPTRRSFLIATGAAGAVFGFARAGAGSLAPATAPSTLPPQFEPTIWYGIGRDGVVTVNIIRAEMGQHIGTSLARIIAEELAVDWDQVRIVHVDSDPKWGLMVTGGSWSVWQTFPLYSQAGAAGRIAMIDAGAKLIGVAPAACTAAGGKVSAGARQVSFADIITHGLPDRSFTPDDLKALPIKAAARRQLIGRPVAALDIPAKVNGSAVYGIDAKIPGMVHARPKLPPTRNASKVVSIDDAAARKVPGYLRSIALDDPSGTVPGWVMVIAESVVAADRACALVNVTWTSGDAAHVSEKHIQDRARALIADPKGGALVVADDGVDAAFASAASTVEATYTTASVLHFQMEPVNALAVPVGKGFEIHTGNQWQSLILPTLAKALGVTEAQVVMKSYLLGGGFGRRLNGDYAVPAALAAKALGRPVKLLCTRADDARFDSIRSPSVQTLRVALGAGGKVTAMTHDVAAGWPTQVMAAFFMPKAKNGVPYDPFAISGADHWYNVGAHRVRALSNDLANSTFRPGWLRSVGPGWINWALESFIDEVAAAAKIDPVAYRLQMLDASGGNAGSAPNAVGGALRQAEVVRRVAAKSGWGAKLPADTGIGIATSFGQERDMPTWVACAARVHVDRATGIVRVQKLDLVVDAGTVVDPDGALAQVEGGALWGLSMALYEGTEIVNGQVADTNLDSYTPLRIGDVPEMAIEFVASTEVPVGLGEPATTVVGPAIGNAIFAATGTRIRHLPMRPAAVLAALAETGSAKR
ncbi:xanthine dehydrogenase family protein molybdopterin-binding subunit [Polymorphobacter arshaanensis]|uniref:Xanthine dehydrogenase family protein molybdopterin-binding subunit n=1 Tax=Glacieibacterium arshaanense TaxID=2511025 RepID=A0A4Y9EQJ3_9SPHN|nr:molybdopterin cofactor-binding domain-containing protein [Polymorphobacter arshaanensis]TFU05866.1 xanthine dehydrogenase family protein molybdopterin-binding subunit [Polymorphobacter arshaanensis]